MKQIFTSERIRFVAVSELLVRDYLEMVNDVEHVQRYLGGSQKPYTEQKEIAWVREKLSNGEQVFSMLDKESGAFIGNIELFDVKDESAELGIAITARMQDRGYGTEAVAALTAYGREALGLRRIRLRTDENNHRAIRVYEKCGFRTCGRRDGELYMELV